MIKAGRWALVLMFWLMGVGLMLAGNVSIPGAVSLLSGLTLPVIASDWVFSRSRARQGKPDDYASGLSDWTGLNGWDIAVLALSMLVGLGLFIGSFIVFDIGG